MPEADDRSTTQTQIVGVLAEGRATPGYLQSRVPDLQSQQQTNYHLRQLRALVERVHRGLYALPSDAGARQTTHAHTGGENA